MICGEEVQVTGGQGDGQNGNGNESSRNMAIAIGATAFGLVTLALRSRGDE